MKRTILSLAILTMVITNVFGQDPHDPNYGCYEVESITDIGNSLNAKLVGRNSTINYYMNETLAYIIQTAAISQKQVCGTFSPYSTEGSTVFENLSHASIKIN